MAHLFLFIRIGRLIFLIYKANLGIETNGGIDKKLIWALIENFDNFGNLFRF